MISRRSFAKGVIAGAAAGTIPLSAVAAPAARRPSMLIQILLLGGIDGVWTTDPKVRSVVQPDVDVPYGEKDILTVKSSGGSISLGPLFRALEPYAPNMAVVNGVACSTVSHAVGTFQLLQMRRTFPQNGPDFCARLGERIRGDRPLAEVRIMQGGKAPGTGAVLAITDQNDNLLQRLREMAANQPVRGTLKRSLDAELQRHPEARMVFEPALRLLERLPTEPMPPSPPPAIPIPPGWLVRVRDAVYLLQHRLSSTVTIVSPPVFDTHVLNTDNQRKTVANVLVPSLLHLFGELHRVRTSDGKLLADEVGIVISSELGRFPVLNEFNGKDHFPEMPFLFLGPGIRPGQYGETDKRMSGTPISPQTGRASSGPRDFQPSIDDVGATILSWFGIDDAASMGFLGKRLDFLLA